MTSLITSIPGSKKGMNLLPEAIFVAPREQKQY